MMGKLSLVTIILSGLVLAGCAHEQQAAKTTSTETETGTSQVGGIKFANPKKSAHYESNTPEHGSTWAAAPINVVVDVNFDLAKPSKITVSKDGKDYGVGETIIDSNKLAMRRQVDPKAPDGLYSVTYNACWPDGSCHDGSFQFVIDRTQAASYQDLTGQNKVEVQLKNTSFSPEKIRVKVGTTVMWENHDKVDHYVNTDPHPAHTYDKSQNSQVLKPGETYEVTFEEKGEYPYHCSAHTNMKGSVVVE